MTTGEAVLPETMSGMIEASTIRTPSMPRSLRLLSTTALNMVVLPALYWLYGERVVGEERVAAELRGRQLAAAKPA